MSVALALCPLLGTNGRWRFGHELIGLKGVGVVRYRRAAVLFVDVGDRGGAPSTDYDQVAAAQMCGEAVDAAGVGD
ncbi:hypothetical protein [Paractinoplanes rishiriensis]|uniref:hypothetical protein n=1 Tax=Paractinoplanes rishiriensis TaxID=1050105 RepID=UPI001EF297BC|nr:hypothetical protein [Actinoplanes rishiriensis]